MKNIYKIFNAFVIVFVILASYTICLAADIPNKGTDINELKKIIENADVSDNDLKGLVQLYGEVTEKYTNEDLAKMIEENKDAIIESGIPEEAISAGTTILKTTDEKELKKVLENDIDLNKVQEMIDNGVSEEEIMDNIVTPSTIAKILLANMIVKSIIISVVVWVLCNIVLRWLLYRKAGKHGWAAIVPIYRDVVYLKVCGISPWLLLVALIPILGWLLLWAIMIVARFELAKSFGKGFLFGLGLLFLGPIFELVIVCSQNIKYVRNQSTEEGAIEA